MAGAHEHKLPQFTLDPKPLDSSTYTSRRTESFFCSRGKPHEASVLVSSERVTALTTTSLPCHRVGNGVQK